MIRIALGVSFDNNMTFSRVIPDDARVNEIVGLLVEHAQGIIPDEVHVFTTDGSDNDMFFYGEDYGLDLSNM